MHLCNLLSYVHCLSICGFVFPCKSGISYFVAIYRYVKISVNLYICSTFIVWEFMSFFFLISEVCFVCLCLCPFKNSMYQCLMNKLFCIGNSVILRQLLVKKDKGKNPNAVGTKFILMWYFCFCSLKCACRTFH